MTGFSAILLAAGNSSRFGSPKMLALVGGEPLVAHMVRAFREGGAGEILVVLAAGAEPIARVLYGTGARVVWNPDPRRGMFSSVRVGLESAAGTAGWIAVSPADIPGIRAEAIQRLREAAATLNENTVVVPTHDHRRGHPIVFAASLRDRLTAWSDSARLSDLLSEPDLAIRHLEGFDEGILRDVDIPADLEIPTRELER